VNALRLCFGLLTGVPVGRLPAVDRRSARDAMLLAPVAALPLGVLVVLAHLLVREVDVPVTLVAALLVTAEAAFTRAMHLDGLADAVDGLGAGGAERGLAVMKASDIGPFGVVALVLALLLQVAALTPLLASALGTLLAAVGWVVSRQVLAWGCRSGVPPAQEQGLGALVAGTVATRWAVLGTLVLAVVAGLLGVAVGDSTDWWQGPVTVLAGVVASVAVVAHCVRRFGGVTGDVLGAAVEVALTAGLVAAALVA
jgi:adenosylcobinamide-GDP ribazoletransferase